MAEFWSETAELNRVRIIDSHTGGEPTRVVIAGGPDLGQGTLSERRERFRKTHDSFRSSVILEPRGSDVLVGALLCQPTQPEAAAGVIFFNNVGYLNMCGHGTIGLAVTLAHLGRMGIGSHQLETPVGTVLAELHSSTKVTVQNVPSYRLRANVPVTLADGRCVHGDIAWGGNWFFLSKAGDEELVVGNAERLTRLALDIRDALRRYDITGADGAEIDHIELIGKAHAIDAHARNFVLCPGAAYDRSPCGTGTSAKLACLAADGVLSPGDIWRQESITGSVFEGTYETHGDRILPRITGEAHITSESTLLVSSADPFRWGIRP